MMVGVTKWAYDQASIDKRQADCDYYGENSDKCKNEAWFIRSVSQQLEEKFGVKRDLTFAFMDSFSQSGPNLNDLVQQNHWSEETQKLWTEATSKNDTFDFKTIDEVLEENAACKEENNRLTDIIEEDIKDLKQNVTSLTADLSNLTGEVTSNQDQISSVSSIVSINSKEITENKAQLTLNSEAISSNTDMITSVSSSLSDEISSVSSQLSSEISDVRETLSTQITNVFNDVLSLTSSYQKHELQIIDITRKGRWCGYQDYWDADNRIITFDNIFFSDTNFDTPSTPLDKSTGKYNM